MTYEEVAALPSGARIDMGVNQYIKTEPVTSNIGPVYVNVDSGTVVFHASVFADSRSKPGRRSTRSPLKQYVVARDGVVQLETDDLQEVLEYDCGEEVLHEASYIGTSGEVRPAITAGLQYAMQYHGSKWVAITAGGSVWTIQRTR